MVKCEYGYPHYAISATVGHNLVVCYLCNPTVPLLMLNRSTELANICVSCLVSRPALRFHFVLRARFPSIFTLFIFTPVVHCCTKTCQQIDCYVENDVWMKNSKYKSVNLFSQKRFKFQVEVPSPPKHPRSFEIRPCQTTSPIASSHDPAASYGFPPP